MEWSEYKQVIETKINSNGDQQITGESLQQVLIDGVDSIIENCQGSLEYQSLLGKDATPVTYIFNGLIAGRKYKLYLHNHTAPLYEVGASYYRFFVYTWDGEEKTNIIRKSTLEDLQDEYVFEMPDDGTYQLEVGFRCLTGIKFPVSLRDITDEEKLQETSDAIKVLNYVQGVMLNRTGGLDTKANAVVNNDYIKVDGGTQITWKYYSNTQGSHPFTPFICIWDENFNFVDFYQGLSLEGRRTLTLPNTARYVRATFLDDGGERYIEYTYNGEVKKLSITNSGYIAKKIEDIQSSLYSNYTVLKGSGMSMVKKDFRGVKPNTTYKLNIHNPYSTSPSGNFSRLYVATRSEEKEITKLLYVGSTSTLENSYTFTVPNDGSIIIRVEFRANVGEEFPISIVEVPEGIGTAITDVNPKVEFLPKMLSAKKKYYTESNADKVLPVVIAHISDIHQNWEGVARFIAFTNEYSRYIDMLLNTGDTTTDYFSDDISGYGAIQGVENIINLIGNHDTATDYSNWQGHVGKDAYNKFIAPWVDNWGVTQPANAAENGYCYSYKDFPENKLRIIFVDIMGYNSVQNSWLVNTLYSANEKGYHVLIATHFAGSTDSNSKNTFEKINCNYTTLYGLEGDISGAGTNKYNTYAYNMMVTVDSFIKTGGIFVGYLQGHLHAELFGKVAQYPNQYIYAVGGTIAREKRDYKYTKGTRNEDEFNIVSIDPDLEIIKLFKVGANIDLYGREKNCLCVRYTTGEIITDN